MLPRGSTAKRVLSQVRPRVRPLGKRSRSGPGGIPPDGGRGPPSRNPLAGGGSTARGRNEARGLSGLLPEGPLPGSGGTPVPGVSLAEPRIPDRAPLPGPDPPAGSVRLENHPPTKGSPAACKPAQVDSGPRPRRAAPGPGHGPNDGCAIRRVLSSNPSPCRGFRQGPRYWHMNCTINGPQRRGIRFPSLLRASEGLETGWSRRRPEA